MKLVLSLIFLLNVQLISCQWSYFSPIQFFQATVPDLIAVNPPQVYENSGVDAYGNPFYEKQVIQTNSFQFPDLEITDPRLKTNRHPDELLNNFSELFDATYDAENFMFGGKSRNQKQPKLNFLTPESAQTFWPFKLHNMPGLAQFKLKPAKPEDITEDIIVNADSSEDNNSSKLNEIVQEAQNKDELVEKDDMAMVNKERDLDGKADENNVDVIQLEKTVEQKEKSFLSKLTANRLQSIANGKFIDSSYIYIQLNKKVIQAEAEDLLQYIAKLAAFPFAWIEDISVSENLILFKVNNIDLDVLCSLIEKNHQRVLEEKSLTIVSCSRGNVEIREFKQNLNDSKKFFIITIVVCLSVLIALISFLTVFVVRRKAYLRQKLMDNVTSFKKKKQFDDVEKLVGDESESAKLPNFMNRVWPFKTKQVNPQQTVINQLDYTDLCRSTKLNNQISPNQTSSTDLSNRCDNFDSPMNNKSTVSSTPIASKSDDRKESNRSSASS